MHVKNRDFRCYMFCIINCSSYPGVCCRNELVRLVLAGMARGPELRKYFGVISVERKNVMRV